MAVFRTHAGAPRVLIANSNLVPRWATWDEFRRLEALGLTMYGQMTAGSWIYIGSQGILQGTYETFAAVADRHFGGSLAGRLLVTGGLGGMGGAQPLAATMLGATMLAIDVDRARIAKRLATRYCDRMTADLDEALAWVGEAQRSRTALSVGLVGNIADVLPELARRGVVPDVLTDQTSAHDTLNGYVPTGVTMAEANNELAFLVTGMYGHPVPKQDGAPLRLVLPWKYGFKSVKSIVKFEFTDQRPSTFWEALQSSEYGFWANVNPAVSHPRWSQASERVLGEESRRPTLIWNGYGDYVAHLYDGLQGERLFA